jgi:DNA-binding transcriptional LysR family regulator/molybdopterin-guanine dinucleotide biosynthesis protein A
MLEVLDARQVRAFAILARNGSYTRTAQELNLTQSAISHAIRSLEEELGCRLFYKSAKKVLLTQQGKQLLQHADAIMQEMGRARARLNALDRSNRGQLRIGCSTASAQFILPTVLREFKESFPGYRILISPGDTPECLQMLEGNQIDIAIGIEPEKAATLTFRRIFTDSLSFLVSPLHPWAQENKARRKEFAQQNYILYSRRSQTFAMIEHFFMRQGIRLRSFIELGSTEAIKELVKLGLGIGIAPVWVARKEIEEGSLVALPLPDPGIHRHWCVIHLKDRPLSLAEETFAGLCQAVVQGFEEDPAPVKKKDGRKPVQGKPGRATFSGILMAGGKSTRMGRDKALLDVEGRPLWKRQIELLQSLSTKEVLVSASRPAWCPPKIRHVPDLVENAGPLGGLAAALETIATSHAVVLAVDMPRMRKEVLLGLMEGCVPGCGVVPVIDGWFEPFSAVYPKEAAELLHSRLGTGDRSLQGALGELVRQGRMKELEIPKNQTEAFSNWNRASDIPAKK